MLRKGLAGALLFMACFLPAKEVDYARRSRPIYEPPTLSLHFKAEKLWNRLLADHLNEDGYLLYNVTLPLAQNYEEAHNSADMPAWHGNWLMALAFKQAVSPGDENIFLIRKGIEALRKNFEATGVKGLLARAYLKHDSDARDIKFLQKYSPEEYPSKYWMQGKNGYWFRNGVAKGHYQGAMFGLACLVSLQNKNKIQLPEHIVALLNETVQDLVHYLIDGGYKIRDWNGTPTEFGNLSDWTYNGQSAVQLLAMLKTCALTGSEKCAREYQRISEYSSTPLGISFYGDLIRVIFSRILSPTSSLYKPNDTIHATSAALAHFLVSDSNDSQRRRNRDLLEKLDEVAGRDRNSFFNYAYVIVRERDSQKLNDALFTLRLFPDDKRTIKDGVEDADTDKIYAINNMKINSHYWKTTWSEGVQATKSLPLLRSNQEYSAQDYLGVYWMARYFNFISEQQALEPVQWN